MVIGSVLVLAAVLLSCSRIAASASEARIAVVGAEFGARAGALLAGWLAAGALAKMGAGCEVPVLAGQVAAVLGPDRERGWRPAGKGQRYDTLGELVEPVKVVRSETRGGQAATGPAEVIQQFLHQVPAPPAFQAHAYALVASAALETRQGSQADRLLTALRQRHWRDVASIRQWLGDRDNVGVYIVLSHDDQTAVLALLSPAEPFGSPSLVDCEYLTTDVASEIEEVFQPSWQPLPGKQIGVVETKSLARPVEAALSARRYLRPLPPEFAVVE